MSGGNTNNLSKPGDNDLGNIVDSVSYDLENIEIEKVAIAYSEKSHLIAMVTDDSLVIWDHIKSRPIAAYEKPASYYSVFRSISASPDGTSFLLEYFGDDEATFFLIGLNQQSFVQSAKQKGKSISTRENSSINELFKIYTTSAVGYFNNQGNIEILANEENSISKYLYLISSGKRDTLGKIENRILIAEYDKITISKPDNRPFIIQEHATGNSSIIPLDALNSFQFPWHDNQSISIVRYGDNYLSADDIRLYIWNENNSKLSQSDLAKLFDKNFRFGKSKEVLNNSDMLPVKRIQQLRNHLSDYPDDFDSWNELGEVYFAVDSFKSAVSSYQESLKLNPDQYDILFNIGKCYSSDSLYSESITYLHRANHLGNPDSSSINIYLAINHYFLSNCDSTLYYLNKTSVEGILVYSDFLYDVAICYMNKYGKLEELIRVIKAELDEIDDSNEGYVLLAYLYIKNGQLIEAEKSLRKVEVDNLSSTEYYHFVYACYYAVMNNKELMIQSLEKLGEDNIPYKELIEFEYEESFKKYKDDPRVTEIFKKFSDLDAER
jgi:tetratricopeptide (TPR) repeat protein